MVAGGIAPLFFGRISDSSPVPSVSSVALLIKTVMPSPAHSTEEGASDAKACKGRNRVSSVDVGWVPVIIAPHWKHIICHHENGVFARVSAVRAAKNQRTGAA